LVSKTQALNSCVTSFYNLNLDSALPQVLRKHIDMSPMLTSMFSLTLNVHYYVPKSSHLVITKPFLSKCSQL